MKGAVARAVLRRRGIRKDGVLLGEDAPSLVGERYDGVLFHEDGAPRRRRWIGEGDDGVLFDELVVARLWLDEGHDALLAGQRALLAGRAVQVRDLRVLLAHEAASPRLNVRYRTVLLREAALGQVRVLAH